MTKLFSIRSSGRLPGKCYIDLAGSYSLGDLAQLTGLDRAFIERTYQSQSAVLDESVGVFYFDSRELALQALQQIESALSSKGGGKLVMLSLEEIEYIRQALINEGSNIINVRNDLKKSIFDKFNG